MFRFTEKLSTLVADLMGETKTASIEESQISEKFQSLQNQFDSEAKEIIDGSKNNFDTAKETYQNVKDGKGDNVANTQKEFKFQNATAKEVRDSKIEAINETNASLQQEVEEHEATLKGLSNQYFHTDAIHKPMWIVWEVLSSWFYWVLLLLVAFAEAPLNRIVFELLGESYLFTNILALALGMVIAMFGHFTGWAAFKARMADKNKKAFYWLIAGFIVVAMLVLAMGIGNMRATFFQKTQDVASVNPYVMGMINFMFYIAASFLAFFHASEQNLSREEKTSYRDLYKVVKTLKKSITSNKAEIGAINQEYFATLNSNATQQSISIRTAMAKDGNTHKSKNIDEAKRALEAAESKYDQDLTEYKGFSKKIDEALSKVVLDLRKAKKNPEKNNIPKLTRVMTLFLPIVMLFAMASCSTDYNNGHRTDVSVLLDVSESDYALGKYVSAEKIVTIMDVVPNDRRGKQNNYGKVSFSTINSLNNNYVSMVELDKPKSEMESNGMIRQQDCKKFIANVDQELKNLGGAQESKTTAIYIPLCQMAQKMEGDNKVIIVISDMMENTERISFYGKLEQLEKNPEQFRKKLEDIQPLPSLTGFTIYFLYTSTDIKRDREFTVASRFWKNLLESKGATIKIASNL